MVYRLRPLELTLDFDDRAYKLGDTISITVELVPNADVDVREARVDLVREERYARHFEYAGVFASYSGKPGTGAPRGPRPGHATQEQKETYLHGSVAFVQNTHLQARRPSRHNVTLEIERVLPVHLDDARELQRDATSSWSFKWTLVAMVDIVRGRNPRKQRAVKIILPELEQRGETPPRVRMSTPKKRTGPEGSCD